MTTFIPTAEQMAALDLYQHRKPMVVEAGAGTGKTATLILLAESTPELSVQYVAFNKAIVTEAGGKLPPNARASTAHSLAFRAVGNRYAHRLGGARMKSAEIARRLDLRPLQFRIVSDMPPKTFAAGWLAGHVMRAVTRFCQTADPEPSTAHFAYIEGLDLPESDGTRGYANNRALRAALLPHVQKAWLDVVNPEGPLGLPFKHEHYLKAWQLEGPRIEADVILFDEAQDANPVMAAIVAAQDHAQRVYVGDSQQAIYEFTGAVNALAELDADARCFLTQSWRFGDAIADVANRILAKLAAPLRLTGNPAIDSRVVELPQADTVLTRTNARAVSTILEAMRDRIPAHLVGGGTEVASFARGAGDLMKSGWTSHVELSCFGSWGEVQEYVRDDAQGGELKLLVELIDEFSVPTILQALDKMPTEAHAALVVSTAHKAKGREWNRVKIGDDFPTGLRGPDDSVSDAELRLMYVAATRARLELDAGALDRGIFAKRPAPLPLEGLR